MPRLREALGVIALEEEPARVAVHARRRLESPPECAVGSKVTRASLAERGVRPGAKRP